MNKFIFLFMLLITQFVSAKDMGFQLPMALETTDTDNPAQVLNQWYMKTNKYCGDADGPGYNCSGLFIRTTDSNPAFFPWDPAPASLTSNGISFSWIRSDFNFTKYLISHGHGYVLYPQDYVPTDRKYTPQLRCGYPVDADTWGRRLDACGPRGTVKTSAPCHTIGIHTAEEWSSNYFKKGGRGKQCGFSFTDGNSKSVERLGELIRARYTLKGDKYLNNEFVFRTWAKGTGGDLPIHSFFYFANSKASIENKARVAAILDQQRYFQAYKIVVPVVKIYLPKSLSDRFTFSYSEREQSVK